jgi:peptidoglycan/xylan/chitin deacetylase (PgdA/CDA1 family)
MYHRVADDDMDPFFLSVSPDNFSAQMEFLVSNYHVLSLTDLLARMKENQVTGNEVVVTFDDGYLDNFINAKPVLEQLNIPATIYMTTGNQGKPYWWDQLAAIVFTGQIESSEISVHIDGLDRKQLKTANKQMLFNALYRILKPLPAAHRETVLDTIAVQFSDVKINEQQRPVTNDELLKYSSPLIEIGAHTVHHPQLKLLSKDRQLDEIMASKVELEHMISRPVSHFSYPFGTRQDFDRITRRLVMENGFESAVTAAVGGVFNGTDVYTIPRIPAVNQSLDDFKKLLNWCTCN